MGEASAPAGASLKTGGYRVSPWFSVSSAAQAHKDSSGVFASSRLAETLESVL